MLLCLGVGGEEYILTDLEGKCHLLEKGWDVSVNHKEGGFAGQGSTFGVE